MKDRKVRETCEIGGLSAGPLRPCASMGFVMACSLWFATALTYHLAASIDIAALFAACAAACIVVAVAVAILYRIGKAPARYIVVANLGLSLGVLGGAAAGLAMHDGMARIPEEERSAYVFEVLEDTHEGAYATSCLAKTRTSSGTEAIVRVTLSGKGDRLYYGNRFSAKTTLKVSAGSSFEFLWGKGAVATATVQGYERIDRDDAVGVVAGFRERALAVFDGYDQPGAPLLRAVLFGDRSGLDHDGFYDRIKVVGLAHMVAVSGAHLVIVTSTIGMVFAFLRIPRRAIVIIQILFITTYLILAAMPVSALRAACMTVIAACSVFFKRKSSTLDALSACIMIIVVSSPVAALSASFMLSALSTIGIVVTGSLFRCWSLKVIPRAPALVHEGIALTLSASIITVPLSAAYFSQVSLISPIMNIFAAPCFTFLCIGGFIAVLIGLWVPGPGGIVSAILTCSDAFCEFIAVGSNLPFAAVPVSCEPGPALMAGLLALSALWLFWPQPSGAAVLAIIAAAFATVMATVVALPLFADDEIIMLDVGQGDAFLIRSSGAAVLVDTGTRDKELLEGLGRHGVYRLDAVMLTHADDDHYGSLQALQGVVQVERVCVADPLPACGCSSCEDLMECARRLVGEDGIVPLSMGDQVRIGSFELSVLWPDAFEDEGGNADSLSLLLTMPDAEGDSSMEADIGTGTLPASQGFTALFCGDLEYKQLASMIEEGRLPNLDILKVGHHGSKHALTDGVAEALQPEIALVSVGAANRYGHPSEEVLAILDRIGCEVFRTDEAGDVVCKLKPGKMKVSTLG